MTSVSAKGRMDGKVVVVTGGGTGLGRAIGLAAAREGARVVLAGRRPTPLQNVLAEITRGGGHGIAVSADVSSSPSVDALFSRAEAEFGRLDTLVLNAGQMTSRSTVADCSDDEWDQSLQANATTVFKCARRGLPGLRATGGSVVAISSVYTIVGGRERAAYVAAKGTIGSLIRGLALDFAADGVRANVVAPAFIETDMNRALLDEARRGGEFDAILRRHPIGRLGIPADVAEAVLFLASDAASWITGVTLPVDGGLSLCAN